jgi:hypothetical protein
MGGVSGKSLSIVFAQTSRGTDPHQAIAIFENVDDEVVREAIISIQRTEKMLLLLSK